MSEPKQKKLRSSEPDLLVTVGENEAKKEYRYHSQVMASHSNYIDAVLASPMKESRMLTLSFPDLTCDVWESMINFLEPAEARHLTVADAMKLAPLYDQYDFAGGRECCDHVIFELFGKIMPGGKYSMKEKPGDLNLLIDAFILADKANLENAKKRAVQYFKEALASPYGFGHLMFLESHIRKLAPLIAKEKLLFGVTKDEILNPSACLFCCDVLLELMLDHFHSTSPIYLSCPLL
jgi:hypothetical protein